ncbi:hypothetical protein ACLOJK_005376 [Asimina triloba]
MKRSDKTAYKCQLQTEKQKVCNLGGFDQNPPGPTRKTPPDAIFPAAATNDDSIPRSYNSSKRFFSPCTTKSIMGEETTAADAEDDLGVVEIGFSGDQWIETGEEDKGEEEEEGRGECMVLEMGFCKESVQMALESLDAYMDFRVSMAEMVEAHG